MYFNELYQEKHCVIINYLGLPPDIQDELQEWHLFGNHRMLSMQSSYFLDDWEKAKELYHRSPETREECLSKFDQWVVENFNIKKHMAVILNLDW